MRRLTLLATVAAAAVLVYLVVQLPGRVDRAGQVVDTVVVESGPQGGTIDWDSVRATRAVVRRRISQSDTYLPAMLVEGDSMLRRWPERVDEPIAVYLPEGGAPGYTVEMGRAVEDAFSRWQRGSSIPVHFRFVRDSAGAEVAVRWIERFDSRRTGQADLMWSSRGWLLKGTLTLATHSPSGWPLSAGAVRTVAVHEIGHLLGLGHSDDPQDVMYPTTVMHDLTLRDRRTAGLLYALPPGSVKDPRHRR